jgi:predicted phage tail protein
MRTKRDRYQSEVQTKLIDRLGSGPELIAFVQSEAGKTFLGSPPEARGTYVSRVLNTVQTGVILIFTGAGMVVVSNFSSDGEVGAFLRVFGGIMLATGAGVALSGVWSYLLLRKWGVINPKAEN